jgi:hypothetical protein
MYMYLQIALSMVTMLKFDRPPKSEVYSDDYDEESGHIRTSERKRAVKRAYLGCYYLSVS